MMILQKTVDIPADHKLFLEIPIPREVPAGKARVVFTLIPDSPKLAAGDSVQMFGKTKSMRGILKNRGITMEQFEEMQKEDKNRENALDETIEELWELCKDVPVTVDNFLKERHEEAERDEAEYRAW